MTYHDLYRKLHDEPFKPFRIKLSNSTTIDIVEFSDIEKKNETKGRK